jgi:hypothetical protein
MTNWSDPQTLWLNIVNALLGIVTIAMLLVVVGVVVHDLLLKWRMAHAAARELEPHTYFAPALGLTMADGGEARDSEAQAPAKDGGKPASETDGTGTSR